MKLKLGTYKNAFASGGNRHCFIYKKNKTPEEFRCIKIIRPERTPKIRRKKQKFIKKFLPLKNFDENLQEYNTYKLIKKHIGDAAFQLIPQCYGYRDTDLTTGLSFELISDYDNKISQSLKQYLWLNGVTPPLQLALDKFKQNWHKLGMPSKNLLLHNMVVQKFSENDYRIVVIDGLGWPNAMFYAYYLPFIARKKAKRKADKIDYFITELLQKKSEGGNWGYHGWIEEQQRIINDN